MNFCDDYIHSEKIASFVKNDSTSNPPHEKLSGGFCRAGVCSDPVKNAKITSRVIKVISRVVKVIHVSLIIVQFYAYLDPNST